MKKLLVVSLLSMTLFSCSKNSEQINTAKKEVEKDLSEIEKKDINYTCTELSDREAYNEIENYHKKQLKKSESSYDEFNKKYNLGKYRTTPLEEMEVYELETYTKMMKLSNIYLDEISEDQDACSNDIKELSKLQGKNTYYKVMAIKTSPDNIIHKKIYLDNMNKIINKQDLK